MNANRNVIVRVSAQTDVGRTRDHNEDTFLVADLTKGTTDFLEAGTATIGPKGSLFLVADGMGGAAAGEIASAMAADAVFEHLRSTWTESGTDSADDFTRHLREAVEVANERIHRYALEHPDSRGMGTTATVVGVFGGRLYLAQVGDSRAYLVRQGLAVQLTKDQSLIQRLIDAGELTEEQAAHSERRNIILQALGPDARIRVDVTYQDIRRGDLLVLCSDGLSGLVKRDEIAAVATGQPDVQVISSRLIGMANERGGPDNITVVAVRFEGPGLAEPDGVADLGYHAYPLPEAETSGEVAAIEPPADDLPAAEEPDEDAPVPVVRRSGSPAVIAAIGVGILLILLALFLLIP